MSEHTHPAPPADRRVKITHLVFGLLFLGIAGIWALGASSVVSGEDLVVLAPALLIGAGVIGLAASLASARNRRHPQSLPAQEHAAEQPSEHTSEHVAPEPASEERYETDLVPGLEPEHPSDTEHTEPIEPTDHTKEIR